MLHINDYNPDDNIMYFVNDDDFAVWCMDPEIKVYNELDTLGNPITVCDYEFSKQYLDAVAAGKRFCIQDLTSHVNKDGYLGYRSTTKKIDNVERYYGED